MIAGGSKSLLVSGKARILLMLALARSRDAVETRGMSFT